MSFGTTFWWNSTKSSGYRTKDTIVDGVWITTLKTCKWCVNVPLQLDILCILKLTDRTSCCIESVVSKTEINRGSWGRHCMARRKKKSEKVKVRKRERRGERNQRMTEQKKVFMKIRFKPHAASTKDKRYTQPICISLSLIVFFYHFIHYDFYYHTLGLLLLYHYWRCSWDT